ncbi:DsbA family protein [Patescibacteria group bacterium]|nr:DsbA family protein [Patescibacteria group bacterium]MBU1448883.1 DsbA family protein [Patescibacteria group bacterium]
MLEDHSAKPGSVFEGGPKAMFFLGLFVGVSTVTTICLALVLGMFLTGKTFGATPVVAGSQVAAANPTANPTAADPTVEQPSQPVKDIDANVDHIRGAKNASVTLITYSDFECPYCASLNTTLEQILKDYSNDVRLVYRHFPLSFHPEAQKAAEAAECAGKQGKFWEMHDAIFAANVDGAMSEDAWKAAAKTLGLNVNDFTSCLDSDEMATRVSQDLNEGMLAGVQGTPATFVNGQLVEGAIPLASFKQIIDQQLQ